MLYALGPLTFEIAPVNAHEINHVTEASYVVQKRVVGRRPPLEFTGDGPEEITVAAKLLPPKFGGLSSLGMLDQMRQSWCRTCSCAATRAARLVLCRQGARAVDLS